MLMIDAAFVAEMVAAGCRAISFSTASR